MPRYIDAEPFGCISWKGIPEGYDDTFDSGVLYVADLIDEAPTVSPDEVRGVGCPACQCKEPLPEDGMSHEYYIRGNTLYPYDTYLGWEGTEISHCPECGARLEVSEDA